MGVLLRLCLTSSVSSSFGLKLKLILNVAGEGGLRGEGWGRCTDLGQRLQV